MQLAVTVGSRSELVRVLPERATGRWRIIRDSGPLHGQEFRLTCASEHLGEEIANVLAGRRSARGHSPALGTAR